MNDIVERLRAATHYPAFVHQEAADEIEKLREAARLARTAIGTYCSMYPRRTTVALDHARGKLQEALGDSA